MSLFSKSSSVRRLRGFLWLLTVCLSAVAVWQFTEILNAYKQGAFRAVPGHEFADLASSAAERASEGSNEKPRKVGDYAVIWESPINGFVKKVVIKVPKVEAKDPKFNKKPIKDVLTVTTLVADTQGKGRCHVLYDDEFAPVSLDEFVLGVGSNLKYPYDEEPFFAKVLKIEPHGVTISWCGDEELVRPALLGVDERRPSAGGEADADPLLTAKERDILNKHSAATETRDLAELGEGHVLIGTDDREIMSGDRWRTMVRVGEQTGANGTREVVLQTVKPGVTRRYGISTGDILKSINGTPVKSRAGAVRYFNQNPDLPKYEVKIERKGKMVTKTYYAPQD